MNTVNAIQGIHKNTLLQEISSANSRCFYADESKETVGYGVGLQFQILKRRN